MWQRIGTQSHSAYEVLVFLVYNLNRCVYVFVVYMFVKQREGKRDKEKKNLSCSAFDCK